jgi:prepilin signal peptidase PulO-like enzyme (type II secretory pathway)
MSEKINFVITYVNSFLSEKPMVGMYSSFGGFIIPFIDAITPILQFLGVLVGLAVGIITFMVQMKNYRKPRNENKKGD